MFPGTVDIPLYLLVRVYLPPEDLKEVQGSERVFRGALKYYNNKNMPTLCSSWHFICNIILIKLYV